MVIRFIWRADVPSLESFLRLEFQVAHAILNVTLATDQKFIPLNKTPNQLTKMGTILAQLYIQLVYRPHFGT